MFLSELIGQAVAFRDAEFTVGDAVFDATGAALAQIVLFDEEGEYGVSAADVADWEPFRLRPEAKLEKPHPRNNPMRNELLTESGKKLGVIRDLELKNAAVRRVVLSRTIALGKANLLSDGAYTVLVRVPKNAATTQSAFSVEHCSAEENDETEEPCGTDALNCIETAHAQTEETEPVGDTAAISKTVEKEPSTCAHTDTADEHEVNAQAEASTTAEEKAIERVDVSNSANASELDAKSVEIEFASDPLAESADAETETVGEIVADAQMEMASETVTIEISAYSPADPDECETRTETQEREAVLNSNASNAPTTSSGYIDSDNSAELPSPQTCEANSLEACPNGDISPKPEQTLRLDTVAASVDQAHAGSSYGTASEQMQPSKPASPQTAFYRGARVLRAWQSDGAGSKEDVSPTVTREANQSSRAEPNAVSDYGTPASTEIRTNIRVSVDRQSTKTPAKLPEPEQIPVRIIADYAFLLGRIVTSDVTDAGLTLIPKGELILAHTVDVAFRHAKLFDLTVKSRS